MRAALDIIVKLSAPALMLTLLLGGPFILPVQGARCTPCHEEVYMHAASSRYLHSIVTDDCEICHMINPDELNEEIATLTSEIEGENVIALGELPEGTHYTLNVIARDNQGNESEPVVITVDPDEVKRFAHPPLRILSCVSVEEVRKGPYVSATIAWDTDAFATSEIEYIASGKYPDIFTEVSTFRKKHRITLAGLKHKSIYRFSVTSRDLLGNVLKSDEYTIDTAGELPGPESEDSGESPPPNIDYLDVFKVAKDDEETEDGNTPFKEDNRLYMITGTNKSCVLTVSISRSPDPDASAKGDKHGGGLAPARFSTMEVCYQCHEQNASHPVDVKSEGVKTAIPDDLPTIEDGRMTCITCHYPHGGDRPYFARLDFNKEICIKCHIGGRYAR